MVKDEEMRPEYRDDKLSELIIQCIIKVHKTLGPGFLESIYKKALLLELRRNHLSVQTEKEIQVPYEGEIVGIHRLDILVEGRVIVEVKTVEKLAGVHYAQIRSYLKATGLRTGILVNFSDEKADFRRVEL